jgi:signal transduction histidine kinase
MFLKRLSELRKILSFRLAVWYSAIFIVSSSILFALVYLLLSSSLRQSDRATVVSKINEYAARYQKDGIDALLNEVATEQAGWKNTLFVRIAEEQNRTIFLSDSDAWKLFDLKEVNKIQSKKNLTWIKIPRKEENDRTDEDILELACLNLSRGYVLQVGKSTAERERLLEKFLDISALIMIPLMLVGFVGGIVVARLMLRPVRELVKVLQNIIRTGRVKDRVQVRNTGDELDELGKLFNNMLAKIDVLIKGMQSSLDYVAHDLRTPMTRFRGLAEMALQSGDDEKALREALMNCMEESDRILTMVHTLLDISEAETGAIQLKLEEVDIEQLIREVVEIYHYVAEEKGITVKQHLAENLIWKVDRNRIQQALANLMDNAIKYTPANGKVEIRAFSSGKHLTIEVRDNGMGIPAQELDKIWQRLYRGDKSRSQRGMGLGLSLVKAIVHAHNGSVQVTGEPGKGAVFSVYL